MKRITMIMLIAIMTCGSISYAADPWKPVQFFDEETAVAPSPDRNTHQFPGQTSWELVVFGNLSTFNISIDASIRCVADSFHRISTLTEASAITNVDVIGSVGYLRGVDFAGYQCVRANIRSKTGSGNVSLWVSPREDSRN